MYDIRFGCQTYPWKMGKKFGELPHMLEVASEAGFQSLEAEMDMLGEWFEKPEEALRVFEEKNMKLAALVLHQDWENEKQTEAEKELTKKAIAFVKHFQGHGAKIMLSHHAGSAPRPEGEALAVRRKHLLACMNEAAVEAAEEGIVCGYHPNSAKNSLFRTEEDYKVMFEMLQPTSVGWVPDVGHIENGGMDALKQMKAHRDLIRHVHFKDRLGENSWAVMGEGTINYPAIIAFLAETDYRGWIMVEDESPQAAEDSDGVVRLDGAYMCRQIRG